MAASTCCIRLRPAATRCNLRSLRRLFAERHAPGALPVQLGSFLFLRRNFLVLLGAPEISRTIANLPFAGVVSSVTSSVTSAVAACMIDP